MSLQTVFNSLSRCFAMNDLNCCTMERLTCLLLMLAVCAAAPAMAQQNRAAAQAELETVRDRINALQKELEREGRRRSKAEKELAEVEQSARSTRAELQRIRTRSAAVRARQNELQQQEQAQQAELEMQQAALAQQLRAAWIGGQEQWLRVALSQGDPATLARRMTYFSYLSRQRSQAIASLEVVLDELADTRSQLALQAEELAQLEADNASRLTELQASRAERADVIDRINAGMATRDAEIQRLQAQAAELDRLVEALAKALPRMPATDAEPFAGQAAQLDWPAEGPVLQKFGQSRADGRLKWNGLLVGASAGSEVRAVYHGRVVFADWLDGMGLLTIVEHDGGYLSLYGHNQDLLREVGEWVAPGDVIAHVGDTGGQAAAGLYFEIRKDGKPVNPGRWLR